jgi:hypothetical protein
MSLYYFESQEKFSVTKNAAQLQAAIDEVIDAKHEIESSDFICSGSEICKTCEYRLYCLS